MVKKAEAFNVPNDIFFGLVFLVSPHSYSTRNNLHYRFSFMLTEIHKSQSTAHWLLFYFQQSHWLINFFYRAPSGISGVGMNDFSAML